jgi:D-glycero-D-manno-heptose 1,7-bisphosphate phosphatase
MLHPAVFLDRDGVIIENCPEYVRAWSDVQIFEQALIALANLSQSQFKIVIVTNQSAIGRGIITFEQAHSINARLVTTIVQAGGRIDGVYMCPHRPEDQCECRKPKPGLLLQAAKDLSINLSQSIMIGDAISDLLAGKNAGIHDVALVRTGRGQSQLPSPSELGLFSVYETLADAVTHLVTQPFNQEKE